MSDFNAVDLELEQYRSLRTEIMRSMEDGNQIMNFGLAAYGLVLNAGVAGIGTIVGFAIFVVALPVFSSLTLSLWFAAQERVARASHFITGIEQRLTHGLGTDAPPTWDVWLRGSQGPELRSRHFWYTEYSGMSIFVFLMIAPAVTGIFLAGNVLDNRTRALSVLFLCYTRCFGRGAF